MCYYTHSGCCSNWSLNIFLFFQATTASHMLANKWALHAFRSLKSQLNFYIFLLTASLNVYSESGYSVRGLSWSSCIFQCDLRHKQKLARPSICVACLFWALCAIFRSCALCTMSCVCTSVYLQYMLCFTTIRLITQTSHTCFDSANKPSSVTKWTLPFHSMYSTRSDVTGFSVWIKKKNKRKHWTQNPR